MIRPISLIIVAASAGLVFFYLKPSYAEIVVLRSEEKQVLATVEQFREAARELERVRSVYQNIRPQDLGRMDTFLRKGFDSAEFALYIHRIAANYGLTITNFSISHKDPTAGEAQSVREFESTVFDFSVEAPYAVFVAFLQDIERSLRPLDISSLKFNSEQKDSYSFNVSLRTYWLAKYTQKS